MVYAAAIQQGKAQQAQDPAAFEKNCVGMRKMSDPEEIRKLEAAAKKLEDWARQRIPCVSASISGADSTAQSRSTS